MGVESFFAKTSWQSFGFGLFLLNFFLVYFSDDDSHENGSTMHSLFDPEAMEQDNAEEANSPVRSTARNRAKARSKSPSPNSSARGHSPCSGTSGYKNPSEGAGPSESKTRTGAGGGTTRKSYSGPGRKGKIQRTRDQDRLLEETDEDLLCDAYLRRLRKKGWKSAADAIELILDDPELNITVVQQRVL